MKQLYLTFFYLICFFMNAIASPDKPSVQITYNVTFPEAQAHYVNIEMNIGGIKQKTIDVKMPVWTPGSYLVREFAKNVESFVAQANGTPLVAYKTDKNTWHIINNDAAAIKITYRV